MLGIWPEGESSLDYSGVRWCGDSRLDHTPIEESLNRFSWGRVIPVLRSVSRLSLTSSMTPSFLE